MKLQRNEFCPVHRRTDCCGRGQMKKMPRRKYLQTEPGVSIIPDDHVPRGFRERRSPSAMKRLLKEKIRLQNGLCGICDKPMEDARDIVPDHKEPRGMNGGRRDDSPDNIQAAHSLCNLEKGSKRIQPEAITS